MVADQNKRMAHTMSTSSRQREGVKWVLNSSIKERDNLSLTFGQKSAATDNLFEIYCGLGAAQACSFQDIFWRRLWMGPYAVCCAWLGTK